MKIIFIACLSGCGADLQCAAPMHRGTLTTLYLGRSQDAAGTSVGDPEMSRFLNDTVAGPFPGFTTFAALGYWKGKSEPATVLQIAHCGGTATYDALARIQSRYAESFGQDSVGRTDAPICQNFCRSF